MVTGPPWPGKKIIYNNLKFYICLHLKKICDHLQFLIMPIKFNFGPVNNILEPFKQKEKGKKKNFELKSL